MGRRELKGTDSRLLGSDELALLRVPSFVTASNVFCHPLSGVPLFPVSLGVGALRILLALPVAAKAEWVFRMTEFAPPAAYRKGVYSFPALVGLSTSLASLIGDSSCSLAGMAVSNFHPGA